MNICTIQKNINSNESVVLGVHVMYVYGRKRCSLCQTRFMKCWNVVNCVGVSHCLIEGKKYVQ